MAPVQLNIVCFRYRAADANRVNGDIVIDIQESGIAAPSTTILDGELAMTLLENRADVDHRVAVLTHRGVSAHGGLARFGKEVAQAPDA